MIWWKQIINVISVVTADFKTKVRFIFHFCYKNAVYTGDPMYIQGDSGGICTTLGNDSMSDSKQKS